MCRNQTMLLIIIGRFLVGNPLWSDDEPELEKRVAELEARMEEMWERMKQYEAVMSTAFRLRDAGDWRIK